MRFFKQFASEELGQDMVEYGLVVALIAMVVLAAVATFGTTLSGGFGSVSTKVGTSVVAK